MSVYEKMLSYYTSWPQMIREGFEKGSLKGDSFEVEGFKDIVICGMGGSGIVGDYFSVLYRGSVPLRVVKHATPPRGIDNKSLLISVSYSGETFETINCTLTAKSSGAKIYAITNPKSTLAQIVGQERVVPVKEGILPRAALADMLGGLIGLIYGKEFEPFISDTTFLLKNSDNLVKNAEEISKKLLDSIPVIAACGEPSVVAIRWGQELAENSKVPSIIERYPESAHNSIVGWEDPPKTSYVFIHLRFGSDRICKLIEDFLPNIHERYGPLVDINLTNEYSRNVLGALLKSSLLAGVVSVLLAKFKGIDPMKTKNIELYKSRVVHKLKEELMRRL